MAVKLETSIKRFIGLSSDTRPTPYKLGGTMAEGETLPIGSVFFEMDTGREYRWEGGIWFLWPNLAELLDAQLTVMRLIYTEIQAINSSLTKNKSEAVKEEVNG